MKRVLWSFVAAILLVSTLIFCSDPVSNEGDRELIPLLAGNFWEFDICTTYTGGAVSDTIMDVLVIDKDSVINDTTWYDSFWDGAEKVGSEALWANLSGGVWTKNTDTSFLWLKYPCEEGDIVNLPTPVGFNTYIETISTDTAVIVKAGQYTCHMYREYFYYTIAEPDTMISAELFYSPGVGPVKYRIFIYDEGGPEPTQIIDMSLVAYHLESW